MDNMASDQSSIISNKSIKQEISDRIPKSLKNVILYIENKLSKKSILNIIKFALWCMYGKIEVYGKIPTGKLVLCLNHVHLLDSVAIKALIDEKYYESSNDIKETSKRDIIFVSKKEHNDEELLKPLFKKHFPTIFIDRENRDIKNMVKFFREAKEAIDKGNIVAIYPEGTRNGLAKGVKPQPGAYYIAKQNNAQVIPIKFEGNFKNNRSLIQKLLFLKRSKIKILIGDPIDINNMGKEEATEFIMNTIMNLKVPENMDKVKKKELH